MAQKAHIKVKPAGKKLTIKENVNSKFVDFCKRTDLHGFKYIVMEDLSRMERICWALAVCISIGFAIYFVITAYKWYDRNPIVTVIESTQGPIWEVPFPAVTICSLNFISLAAAKKWSDNLSLPVNKTRAYVFETIKLAPLLFMPSTASNEQIDKLQALQDILDYNSISVKSFFTELSPTISCDNLIERCMWKNTMYRCEQLFQHIFSTVGLCCAFNYYAVDISLTSDNSELLHMPTPRRVASCGYQTALTVILKTDPNDYFSTITASQGTLVFIENAYNHPDLDSSLRVINPAEEVMIAISPESTYSTPGIRTFNPSKRKCYYKDEVHIGDFVHYSFHNCKSLQKMENIEANCECTPFYFPIKEKMRACNFYDMRCIRQITDNQSEGIGLSLKSSIECLPECEHFDYPLETAFGEMSNNVPLGGLTFFENIDLENKSVLNVFFNDLVSTRYRRDVNFNWQNLLAAFGGLLSLMLGFTLISGFDFFIFLISCTIYDCKNTEVTTNRMIKQPNVISIAKKQSWQSKKLYSKRY